MANLFDEADFALFTQYQGKSQDEAPEGFDKLRNIYDKLGEITDELNQLGYTAEIIRNPLRQAGRGQSMKYGDYHWARVYPKDLYEDCGGKIFVVVGTSQDGLNIHIDSYGSKGYECNEEADRIKENTWEQLSPQEASQLSCEEIVKKVIDYIEYNWESFNLFGKEFRIRTCIENLNKMEMEKIKKLLLSNHNLILTGAPGTGKTYLAKEIAKDMGAEWKLVQFHPSYDYTDFVEGLRPIKDGSTLGFQRKDGVFKEFCKNAIESNSFEKAYQEVKKRIDMGENTFQTYGSKSISFKVENNDDPEGIMFTKTNGDTKTAYKERLLLLYNYYIGKNIKTVKNANHDEMAKVVGNDIDYTFYRGILQAIMDAIDEHFVSKPYIFIIDEINRGEISKIFGELFYSIDAGYRGEKGRVETQYQNLVPKDDVFSNGFYVPENVYIIGTMNDIDRSVESMDFAMRRRFAWKEITAESSQSMLDNETAWGGNKPEQEVIDEIKNRMNNLNACIIDKYGDEEPSPKDKVGLTKAYQIGASYFLKYGMYGNFEDLWTNHLEGLLYEYLRGTTNIEAKIERLQKAYNDTTEH